MKKTIRTIGSILLILSTLSMLLSGCGDDQVFTHDVHDGNIQTQAGVFVDTEKMTLTFGEASYIHYGAQRSDVSKMTLDLSFLKEEEGIYFDPQMKRLSSIPSHGSVHLGTFHLPMHLCEVDMDQSLLYIDQIEISVLKEMHGKKVLCLGDNMTAGVSTTKVYYEYLQERCGFSTVADYGVAGSCIAPKTDPIPAWETGIGSFLERYETMEEDADLIIVFGGVNDWTTGRDLGSMEDAGTDTFYGSMKALCSGLTQKYPDAQIFFFSSPQNDFIGRPASALAGTQWEGNTQGYNRKGFKLQDYAAAMEEVCTAMDVHFYSLTDALPWSTAELGDNNGQSGTYGTDGLHPNADGHAVIAKEMARFLQTTYAKELA